LRKKPLRVIKLILLLAHGQLIPIRKGIIQISLGTSRRHTGCSHVWAFNSLQFSLLKSMELLCPFLFLSMVAMGEAILFSLQACLDEKKLH